MANVGGRNLTKESLIWWFLRTSIQWVRDGKMKIQISCTETFPMIPKIFSCTNSSIKPTSIPHNENLSSVLGKSMSRNQQLSSLPRIRKDTNHQRKEAHFACHEAQPDLASKNGIETETGNQVIAITKRRNSYRRKEGFDVLQRWEGEQLKYY